jgi:peptide/nickel transport system ATP-binding protein
LAASGLPRTLGDWPERVGLTRDLLRRFPHEVSEGQLQRACLARALIVRPRYLICDELSSMLDVSTQAALLETIAGVADLGVLLITHDRVLADTWCDEVVAMRDTASRHRQPAH